MVVNNPRAAFSLRTSSIHGPISAIDASVRFNHCPLGCDASAANNRSRWPCLRVNTSQRSSPTNPALLPIGVRQLLSEGMILSLWGSVIGIGLAELAMIAIKKLPDGTIPRADALSIHWTVVLVLATL